MLQDYRPGMTRADLEDAERRQRRRQGLEAEPDRGRRSGSTRWAAEEPRSRRPSEPGPRADGSFSSAGPSGSRTICLPHFAAAAAGAMW